MKAFCITALVLVSMVAFSTDASAQCPGGPCGQVPYNSGPFAKFFGKQPLPAFQAAPWYSYWPYNAHFMTPAPLMGAYYAPPTAGGMMGNPYFPAGGYGMPVQK